MQDLLRELNPEQKKAVVHESGPLLIIAGAGTGKTTVITKRIAWLINECKIKPEEILALTFTDKAAGEMEERVDKLLPYGYVDLWISTFHSFAERILKQHALDIGLPSDFKLLNQTEQWLLIRENLDKFNLNYYRPLGNPTKFIHALIKHFSRAKDEVVGPEEYLEYAENLKLNKDDKDEGNEKDRLMEIANAYHVYENLLLENNALDFGDIINYTLKLFRKRPNILEQYREQFKYILLDEFQDTNWAQYELIKLLTAPKNNLTVVGDDDQCLPGNSLISLPDRKKRIKNLKMGDEVLCGIGRSHIGVRKISKIIKNKKKSRFLEITTKCGKKIKITDNHKMFVYLPNYSLNRFYVYLMKREDLGYRLGITNNPLTRLRLERSSDSILLLADFLSEKEARYHETLWSLKYGIPTSCFKEREGIVINNEKLNELYKNLDVNSSVLRLAADLKKDLNFHHYYLAGVYRGGKSRVKINLEICCKNYRLKKVKNYARNFSVAHSLNLETSDPRVISLLKKEGFLLKKAKKGHRLRKTSSDLKSLIILAGKIKIITNGIAQETFKIATLKEQSLPALVVPAKNLVRGIFIPVEKGKELIYDEIVDIKESYKTETVYDLEIKDTHNFIADGVAVHNSIYKFRGASVSNILQFKKDYPKAAKVVLNTNYRSAQEILDLSHKFIKQNDPNRLEAKEKINKSLKSVIKEKGILEHLYEENLDKEIAAVLKKIVDLKKKDKEAEWSDFAILVRANDSAAPFVQKLKKSGIPHQFLALRGLYAKPVILDVINYFKLLDNYHESVAMYRVLIFPFLNISTGDLSKLNYESFRSAESLYEVCKRANAVRGISETGKKDIAKILSLVEKHSNLAREKNVSEIYLGFLKDSGYLEYLTGSEISSEKEAENQESLKYLSQFYKKITEFENSFPDPRLHDFMGLLNLELESGEEGGLSFDVDSGPDMVRLMTIHAAKGLEFKYVFIPGMVDKRFPTIERKDPIELPDKLVKEIIPEGDIHLEEERRLMYVAMTRAKLGLFFSSAKDYGGAREKKMSRFLVELGFEDNEEQAKKDDKSAGNFTSENKLVDASTSKSAVYYLPNKFSFTQLAAFSACPLQYKFAHILHIPVFGKPVFSFGKTIHGVMQKFFEEYLAGEKVGQKNLFGKTAGERNKKLPDEKRLLEIYDESWIDEWYANKKSKKEYYDKGKKALKEFYKNHEKNIPDVLHLEQGFNIKIGEFTLRGRIDRVDRLNGGVEIVDYKTGQSKEKLDLADKKQLLIYQIASEEALGLKPERLTYYYIEDNKKLSFIGKDKEIDDVKEKIINDIQNIRKSDFTPTPGNPMPCKFCDFKHICEFKAPGA